MSLFIQIFTHMDSTMLGLMTSDRYVGLYSASTKMTAAVSSLITALSLVAMPRISYYVEQKKFREIRALSVQIINIILMLGVPAAIGMSVLSKELIHLFCGPAYLDADLASKVMSLRVLLVPLNSFIVLHLFIPLGREKNNLLSTGAAALFNLVANAVLIPRFYHLGAGFATVLAEGIELVVNLYFLSSFVSLKSVFASLWKYVLAGAFIGLLCQSIIMYVDASIFSITVCVAASVITYFAALYLLRSKYVTESVNRLIMRGWKK